MTRQKSFTEWMRDVNVAVGLMCGMDADDLPDYCYADAYEDGVSVNGAARAAIRAAME